MHASFSSQKPRSRAAFTLVELLTVIAVIGILAAILIPVVGRVRESARSSDCVSKLRQIGMVCLLYADERGRFLPAQARPGGDLTNWIIQLTQSGYAENFIPIRENVDTIWICPSARNTFTPTIEHNANTYGANAVALGDVGVPGTANTLSRLSSPARTALAMDGVWNGELFLVSVHPESLPPTPIHPPGPNTAINVVFMDGHVEKRRIAGLPSDPNDLFWNGRG